MATESKSEHTGVLGYVDDATAKRLLAKHGESPTVDLRFERGTDTILMRVNTDDIKEIKPGESEKGETLLHVILKDGSQVHTVIKAFRNMKGIQDPTLSRLTAAASVSVSFV
jgi:hypothetical protein